MLKSHHYNLISLFFSTEKGHMALLVLNNMAEILPNMMHYNMFTASLVVMPFSYNETMTVK